MNRWYIVELIDISDKDYNWFISLLINNKYHIVEVDSGSGSRIIGILEDEFEWFKTIADENLVDIDVW